MQVVFAQDQRPYKRILPDLPLDTVHFHQHQGGEGRTHHLDKRAKEIRQGRMALTDKRARRPHRPEPCLYKQFYL